MTEICYESSDVDVIKNLRAPLNGQVKFKEVLKSLEIGEACLVKVSCDGYPLVVVRLSDLATKHFYVRVIRDWQALQKIGWMPLDLPTR